MNRLGMGLVALGLSVGCAKQPSAVQVQMAYEPEQLIELGALPQELLDTPLRVGEVTDSRSGEKDLMGENREHKKPIAVRTEPALLKASVRQSFESAFKQAGLNLDPQAHTAVNIEIAKLWVQEGSDYEATAQFNVTVVEAGAKKESFVVQGSALTHGASLNEEEYRQALSGAILSAVSKLINSGEFHAILMPPTVPTEAVAAAEDQPEGSEAEQAAEDVAAAEGEIAQTKGTEGKAAPPAPDTGKTADQSQKKGAATGDIAAGEEEAPKK